MLWFYRDNQPCGIPHLVLLDGALIQNLEKRIKMAEFYDIGSTSEWPAGELSNFTEHHFTYDSVQCFSMEGLLQALKYEDPRRQKEICRMVGREAKAMGNKCPRNWKLSGMLFWQGYLFNRHGDEYQELLSEAYLAVSRNKKFRDALLATGDAQLIHTLGKDSPYKTVLTSDEFCSRLMVLRAIIKSHYESNTNKIIIPKG